MRNTITLKALAPITRLLFMLAVITACCSAISAQADASRPSPNSPSSGNGMIGPAEEEMRAKREIDFAEKAHRNNLARARDLASLGSELGESFEEKKRLDQGDFKKLEKVEKLAKRLREAAGGEGKDIEFGKPPADLAAAMCRVSELTSSLKDRVEKTPKRVVSTAIIDEANILIELIRAIRGMHPKT